MSGRKIIARGKRLVVRIDAAGKVSEQDVMFPIMACEAGHFLRHTDIRQLQL